MSAEQNADWNMVVMAAPGSGMSYLANRIVHEQVAAGAVAAPKMAPYYRQFDKRKF